MKYYFVKTLEDKGRPRVRALSGQTFEDGTPVDTTLNVRADREIRTHYPMGTVYGVKSLSMSAGFLDVELDGDSRPMWPLNVRSYKLDSHKPPIEMVKAYEEFIGVSTKTPKPSTDRSVSVKSYLGRLMGNKRFAPPTIEGQGFFVNSSQWYLLLRNVQNQVNTILLGATGTGKTELVRVLSQELFDTPETLIRLDMSEFMEKHSVSRIVGSPPGYVGYDEAGQLTEKIRRKPYSVVLFDEIEKAHPDVLNVLLQILDDGQITDAHGRKVNFENTVIVMTSNAGSDKAAGSVGFDKSAGDQGKERVMKALREFLRPEFINRVDEVIYFHQLTEENFRDIARIMLDELKTSLADKGFGFMYDDSVVDVLVKKSYSAAYGARNLRRCIQKELEDPMANLIIDAFENPITQLKATTEDGQIKLYSL